MDFKQRPPLYYSETQGVRTIDQSAVSKQNGNQNVVKKENTTHRETSQRPYEADYIGGYGVDLTRRMVENDRRAMTAIYNGFFGSVSDEDLYEQKKNSHLDIQTSFYDEKEITRQKTSSGIMR